MARIRLILEDDDGTLLTRHGERVYDLGTNLGRLDLIEAAATQVRCQALPDLQADLLAAAQQRALAQEKKRPDSPATD